MTAVAPTPDNATRVVLGCAVAFLGVFLVFGLLVVLAVLQGRSSDPSALFIGLCFVVAAFGGLLLVRRGWRAAARQDQRRRTAPDQPWAWKRDWSTGVVKGTSSILATARLAGFAGVWLGGVALITMVAWDKVREQAVVGLFLAVFWAAGLSLVAMVVRAILHARRFGSSWLAFDATPARLGGWLSGVVRAPLALQGTEAYLQVSCIETVPSSGRSSSSSTFVRWQTTKVLDGTRFEVQADRVEIPFAVRLPTNEEAAAEQVKALSSSCASERSTSPTTAWTGTSGSRPGFPASTTPTAFPCRWRPRPPRPPSRPLVAPRVMPELTGEQLAQRLPARLEYQSDADVFVFPVQPSWIVWILVLSALAATPFFADAPLLAGVPPGVLKWGAIVCGVLAAVSVISLMLHPRSIEVRWDAVHIRRGILGVGFHQTIPRSQIVKVEEESSRSEPTTYSVNIRLRNGRSHWAALALSEPDQAAALAARLRQILGVG